MRQTHECALRRPRLLSRCAFGARRRLASEGAGAPRASACGMEGIGVDWLSTTMSSNKRPSTSSLRRYLTSRPYLSVADIRRRFGLDADAMSAISCNGARAFIGLPEREASKLQDLWQRDEIGVELSVEVRAPVVVGVYPMRIARFVLDQAGASNGSTSNGHAYGQASSNGQGNGLGPPSTPGPLRERPIYADRAEDTGVE